MYLLKKRAKLKLLPSTAVFIFPVCRCGRSAANKLRKWPAEHLKDAVWGHGYQIRGRGRRKAQERSASRILKWFRYSVMSDDISLMRCLICSSGPCLGSAVLEDCALCQETIPSSELAAKAREGQFEGWYSTLVRWHTNKAFGIV